MRRVADDQHTPSLRVLPADNVVDLPHKGTGGIHKTDIRFFRTYIINSFFHAVGTDDHGPFAQRPQFLLGSEDAHAAALQVTHHFFIVDHRPVRIDRGSTRAVRLLIYCVHRPAHAETESRRLRQPDFSHPASFLLTSPRITSVTSAAVMAELSTRTASSACFSGAVSRCISR